MTIQGETILTGAPSVCCGVNLKFEVLRSAAGYYIGTACPRCGPYSRESNYFISRQEAEDTLVLWREGQYDEARTDPVEIPEDQRLRAIGAPELPGLE
jgi:hypothetical protein